jgi:hypothetical protein
VFSYEQPVYIFKVMFKYFRYTDFISKEIKMMKMTALLTAALMSLGYGTYDAKAQATYFGDEPEGVQSFQQDKDAWRRKDGKRLQILQGISDSIGQAALANITGAEQVFCYQITSRPNNYSGYTINGMVVTGFCGVVAPQLQETIKEQFFSTADNIDFVNSEKCIIKPKIMIRWVRGVDFTDMLISAPCYSYSIFYGGKVRTFNFRPGAELVDAMVDAFKDLTVPFVSPALLNQLLPVGVPQTKEQQEIVKEQSGPIRKWEQPKAQPVQEKKNKGWNSLKFGV